MAGWFDRLLPPPTKSKGTNLPALNIIRDLMVAPPLAKNASNQLPNATLIYGIAAGAFFAVGFYSLITGAWFTALLLFLPAGCFLGFALYYLRHPS